MILENPFQILLQKLENIESTLEELRDRMNQIEGRGIKIDEPATIKDAAKYLGVSVGTVNNLLKSNQLKPFRVGTSVRFTYKDLDEFIEKKKD